MPPATIARPSSLTRRRHHLTTTSKQLFRSTTFSATFLSCMRTLLELKEMSTTRRIHTLQSPSHKEKFQSGCKRATSSILKTRSFRCRVTRRVAQEAGRRTRTWINLLRVVFAGCKLFLFACDCSWHYNVSTGLISTEELRSPSGSAYCLTAGTDSQSVYASLCASTERSDDVRQRWAIEPDATIRPLNSDWAINANVQNVTALCLTNGNPVGSDPSTAVFLEVLKSC